MSGLACLLPLAATFFSACAEPAHLAIGYAEGDYALIAPLATAQVASLAVRRGDHVAAGATLVTMESRDAVIALAEAEAGLSRAESQLANLREGRRPEEIRALDAALVSARVQAAEAARTRDRIATLAQRGAATSTQADDARTAAEVARFRVAEAEATLAVARLPARDQEITAAAAAVAGARAARDRAQWTLDQRSIAAPADGTVTDVIRHPGEIAGPGTPVLEFLPDGAVKLRLYLPETDFARVAAGMRLAIGCDGCTAGLTARITYVAAGPEYTPPVIYSLQNRQKLVYMIEARPEGTATGLKPGQIVEADLPADTAPGQP